MFAEQLEQAVQLHIRTNCLLTLFAVLWLAHLKKTPHFHPSGHFSETLRSFTSIPAVVSIEPAQHRILVELLCAVYSVDEPPVVLVAPDPALAVRFVQPEDDPFEELYAAEEKEAIIERL